MRLRKNYEIVNPTKVETDVGTFYIATYRVAHAPDRLCALVTEDASRPFAVSHTKESRDEFVQYATDLLARGGY